MSSSLSGRPLHYHRRSHGPGYEKLSSADSSVSAYSPRIGDPPEFLSVKWKAVRQGSDPSADIRSAPYDVVYVPKLGIAEVYQFYNQYIQQFANPYFGFMYIVAPQTTR